MIQLTSRDFISPLFPDAELIALSEQTSEKLTSIRDKHTQELTANALRHRKVALGYSGSTEKSEFRGLFPYEAERLYRYWEAEASSETEMVHWLLNRTETMVRLGEMDQAIWELEKEDSPTGYLHWILRQRMEKYILLSKALERSETGGFPYGAELEPRSFVNRSSWFKRQRDFVWSTDRFDGVLFWRNMISFCPGFRSTLFQKQAQFYRAKTFLYEDDKKKGLEDYFELFHSEEEAVWVVELVSSLLTFPPDTLKPLLVNHLQSHLFTPEQTLRIARACLELGWLDESNEFYRKVSPDSQIKYAELQDVYCLIQLAFENQNYEHALSLVERFKKENMARDENPPVWVEALDYGWMRFQEGEILQALGRHNEAKAVLDSLKADMDEARKIYREDGAMDALRDLEAARLAYFGDEDSRAVETSLGDRSGGRKVFLFVHPVRQIIRY